MRHVMCFFLVLASAIAVTGAAFAFTRTAARFDGGATPRVLSTDCTLNSANLCAGWIWVFNDVEGAVWGTVLDPDECNFYGGIPGVADILVYSRCSTTPGRIDNVAISKVDAVGCRTALLYQSGPITMVHCVAGDRWTSIVPGRFPGVGFEPFAVTVTWGPQSGGVNNPQLASDNGIANLYCQQTGAYPAFPGCATSTTSCVGWRIPPQRTFIYVTDINGDGSLDDFCALYGRPYPLAFPYLAPYGYLPNNLILSVGIDSWGGTPVQPTTWGHVKSLFD